MEVQGQVRELVDQELPLALEQVQEPALLRVLELMVQALEQVVRVTALEMEQVRAEVLVLARELDLVEELEEAEDSEQEQAPVLALVPDLVQVEESVEVLEPGQVPG